MFNTIAEAVKVLGEVRTLNYINAYAKNMAYRKDRQKRVKAEEKEAKAIVMKVKNDPRFADLFKATSVKKVG